MMEALLIATLLTPISYGDLSRMGRLSESDFGWRKPAPMVEPDYLKGSPLDEAEILVIGDSFSMTHGWQSRLVIAGYKVANIHWSESGPLCADFSSWIQRSGFKGQLVVVQSVERALGSRLLAGRSCETMPNGPIIKTEPTVEPLAEPPSFALNWDAPLSTPAKMFVNARRIRQTQDALLDNLIWVRSVPDGCRKFSHRLCNKALFFIDDALTPPLDSANAHMISAFNASQPDFQFMWLVIPDKTTVYFDPDRAASFMEEFRRSNLGPDLFEFSVQQSETEDFYLGNDTHLSIEGQLVLGEFALRAVQELLPQ